jgi:uncharacterized protein (DUF1015 family)
MLEVRGLRGLRFNPEKVGGLGQVVTPPYDVISPAERQLLAETSPYNMAHLLLPEASRPDESPYDDAARRFRHWQEEGVLQRDETESVYLLEQRFHDLEGRPTVRRGFYAVARVPEAGEKTVLGHERTFDKPVADRLALTAATRANLGAVFALYADPEGQLQGMLRAMDDQPPLGEARTIDGVVQRIWRTPFQEELGRFFRDKTLYIADGHHRFQTAQAYRDQRRAAGGDTGPGPHDYDYVLMAFVAFEDAGLKIYPPHRVAPPLPGLDVEAFLTALAPWFEVIPVEEDVLQRLEQENAACAFGLCIHGRGPLLLRLKEIDRVAFLGEEHGPAWRDLDVAVLHRGIFEGILGQDAAAVYGYEKDAETAIEEARSGRASMTFLMRPAKPEQIRACAEAGERMPQKATYFFPKIASGLVIHTL